MATIAEIIAAKQAKQAGQSQPMSQAGQPMSQAEPKKESIAERLALKEAVDRIDPPGKCEHAAAARKMAGIILSRELPAGCPNGENRGQATPIAGPEEIKEPRSLSQPAGEAVPVVPVTADKEETTWHEAMNSYESSLCIMRDPREAEVIWLAVRAERAGMPPILLHRLPWLLWEHPLTVQSEPF